MLLLLLHGEIHPAAFFKLARVVKLRVQIGVVSRETLKCDQKWTLKDSHASARPYEGVRQCLSPGFVLVGLYPPRRPPPAQPSAICVKNVSLVASR